MKKIICLALALLVVLSLAACGNFDQKVYFLGTWTCGADEKSNVPASTMTIKDDYTGVLEYGDVTYTFNWVSHPGNPEIMLVKEMKEDNGDVHVPTEKSKYLLCAECHQENLATNVKDNKCPRPTCGAEYPEDADVSCVLRCTYTVYKGKVRMMVNDGDGQDTINKMNMIMDKNAK